MKTTQLFISACSILIMTSCLGNSKETVQEIETDYTEDDIIEVADLRVNTNNSQQMELGKNNPQKRRSSQDPKLKWFEIKNTKTGLVSERIPFPATWRRVTNNRDYAFEGPNNLKISGTFGRTFTYNNPNSMYGGNNTPPMDIQQIINNFFMPIARQSNRTLIKHYELPSVARNMLEYQKQLWDYMPTRKTVKAYGIDWVDNNNMKYVTVIYVSDSQNSMGGSWTFFGNFLQAPAQDFDAAKSAFIYGIENTQFNPEQIAAHNQNEVGQANIRHSQHQQRMAAINARGQANLNVGKVYSDILDISHAGYLNRSNINSQGHSRTINGINETVIIANQSSGERYNVPMGSKYYWVSNDGTYFGTDNSLYNPNSDKRIYDKNWTKFEIEN